MFPRLSVRLSIALAAAGLLFTWHDLRHPQQHFGLSTPLLGLALLIGAWGRICRRLPK